MTTTTTPRADSLAAVGLSTPQHPAVRSTTGDVRTVPAALKSEWLKLSTIRSNKAMLALTAGVGGFTSWAVATFVTDEVLTVAEVFIFSTVLTGVFAAVTGVLLFSSEVQHGTLAAALTAQPARWVVAAAKTIMAAACGLVLGAAGMAAGFAGAVLAGLDLGDTSSMAATTLWALVFTSLAAVLGLGIGMIVRHSSGAISGLLVWGLVVENLLTVFAPDHVTRFLPFVAGNALLAIEAEGALAESAEVALSRPQDALVFGGYTLVALALGTVLLYRRDTN